MIFLAAILGYWINGPIGAFVGIALVWILNFVINSFNINRNTHATERFINSLFSMLAKMAKADGIITKEEIDAVTQFMNTIRLSSKDKEIAINAFRKASLSQQSIYEYASQYKAVASAEMRGVVYAVLWGVAHSDGVLHKQEDEILRKIPEYLGLHNGIYNDYKNNTNSQNHWDKADIDKHYETLECTKDNSDKEIKKAYRKAISKHHPDKIQSQGLPKEFMDYANEQSKKINKAYDAIKASRK
ncbi:DnaJ-like protein DjlA [hydrothermal vent metagenome]|uniref:DnaJ-like protein DjlA n=1 Tax=hydrothermal vent metagenome TaxID=652676 RepID=A0A1W1E2C0_9ZZZZ